MRKSGSLGPLRRIPDFSLLELQMIKKIKHFIAGGILLVSAGCYTQFAVVDKTLPETIKTVIDSTGDTVKVIERTDTVFQKEHEVCVWERDLMGYPHLRCYKTFYPRDWFVYRNTPWWYRNDPFWSDFDRCPRYYYFDPDCGCCRYSTNRYDYFDRDHHYDHGSYSGGGGNGGHSGGGNGGGSNSGAGSSGSSGISSGNKDSRTTATKIVEPAPSQAPAGSPKVAPAETTPEVPKTQPEVNEPQKSDTVGVIKKRNLRSLRSR
jgi:hypothetical protein